MNLIKRKAVQLQNVHQAGFTMTELLVAIGVIGALAAITFPVFSKVKAEAQKTKCLSNERQIGLAMAAYVADYDDYLPQIRTSDLTGIRVRLIL